MTTDERVSRMGTPTQRFWRQVDTSGGPDSCWPWTGAKTHNGYGTMGIGSRRDGTESNVRAHRFAWELTNGPIPEGMFVLHDCDTRACCNARHLRVGTPSENTADMIAKGRDFRGNQTRKDGTPFAKLTTGAVREIRMRKANGERTRQIAKAFAADPSTIRLIVTRKTWQHVS